MRPQCVSNRDDTQQKAEDHANVILRSGSAGCGTRTRKPSRADVFETSVYAIPPTRQDRLTESYRVPLGHRL